MTCETRGYCSAQTPPPGGGLGEKAKGGNFQMFAPGKVILFQLFRLHPPRAPLRGKLESPGLCAEPVPPHSWCRHLPTWCLQPASSLPRPVTAPLHYRDDLGARGTSVQHRGSTRPATTSPRLLGHLVRRAGVTCISAGHHAGPVLMLVPFPTLGLSPTPGLVPTLV